MDKKQASKREFIKKVSYIAPAILTLQANPTLASFGSVTDHRPKGNNGVGNGCDPQPPGNPPINDKCGVTGPGNPGNKKFFDPDKRFFSQKKHKQHS